ncbi:MAG TPA: hypothetical protein PLM53_12780 [Spirochaetota bacterium]|nr:hypothetical protein [Spirochaetota bacterium]HPC40676.1 hypothetical protein [Spirochaetota bacterium]HQF09416.1 hypothetical protein [Spirochaetota bacterium]HQH97970.1 hypothetical protein [Spirochaetota bacterium]
MNYYAGKTVLITGAYGGFGRQFIAQLMGHGASLILSDIAVRDIAGTLGPEPAKKLPADWKKKIIAEIPADLSTADGRQKLYDQCRKTGFISTTLFFIVWNKDNLPSCIVILISTILHLSHKNA